MVNEVSSWLPLNYSVCPVSTGFLIAIICGGPAWSLPEGFQPGDHPKASVLNTDLPLIHPFVISQRNGMTGRPVLLLPSRRLCGSRRGCVSHLLSLFNLAEVLCAGVFTSDNWDSVSAPSTLQVLVTNSLRPVAKKKKKKDQRSS